MLISVNPLYIHIFITNYFGNNVWSPSTLGNQLNTPQDNSQKTYKPKLIFLWQHFSAIYKLLYGGSIVSIY